jgi:hypothetical protein
VTSFDWIDFITVAVADDVDIPRDPPELFEIGNFKLALPPSAIVI